MNEMIYQITYQNKDNLFYIHSNKSVQLLKEYYCHYFNYYFKSNTFLVNNTKDTILLKKYFKIKYSKLYHSMQENNILFKYFLQKKKFYLNTSSQSYIIHMKRYCKHQYKHIVCNFILSLITMVDMTTLLQNHPKYTFYAIRLFSQVFYYD